MGSQLGLQNIKLDFLTVPFLFHNFQNSNNAKNLDKHLDINHWIWNTKIGSNTQPKIGSGPAVNPVFYSLLCLSLCPMVAKRVPRIHPRGIFHHCQNQRSDQVGIRRRYQQQSWWVFLMMPRFVGIPFTFNDCLVSNSRHNHSFFVLWKEG